MCCTASFGTHLAFCMTKEVDRTRCPSIPQRPHADRTARRRTTHVVGVPAARAVRGHALLARRVRQDIAIRYSDFKQRARRRARSPTVEIGKERHPRDAADEQAQEEEASAGSSCASTIPTSSRSSRRRRSSSAGCRRATGSSSLFMVWLLPMLLLGGFWLLVFRRMKPGAGMMSIGQPRAASSARRAPASPSTTWRASTRPKTS